MKRGRTGRIRRACALLAVCSALSCIPAALGGCAQEESPRIRYLRVGVVEYNAYDTFIGELVDCLKEDMRGMQTDTLNITLTVKDAEGSQRTEDKCVQDLIDGGCDVLCVNLVDRATPSAVIDMAMAKDIPVIFFNREPVREDLMQWEKLYYVGSEPKESGVMQGELAAAAIRENSAIDRNRDGKIQYVLLEGEPGHQDAIVRTENSVRTLMESVQLEKLSYCIANWNRAQAQTKMAQQITQYGSRIELVLANNDDMALGAIDAYDRKNITEADRPVVFGTDGTKEGLQAIVDGTMAGTVYNDKEGQARAIAALAMALYEGSDLSAFDFREGTYIYLPYEKVTPENVDTFVGREQNTAVTAGDTEETE